MARLVVFNALISSERASVTAASTVKWRHASRSFSRTKRCLHQPTSQHWEWQSVVCWHKTWCLFKSALSAVDRESQVCTASYGLCGCVCVCKARGACTLFRKSEKSKVNADYYVNELLPKLMDNCHHFAWPTFHISARWSTCACSKIDRIVAGSLPSLSRLHRQGRMASKQPGFESTWLPRLGLEEYPGAEDSASDDMGWAAARSYQKVIVSFRKRLRACVNAEGGRFEYKL